MLAAYEFTQALKFRKRRSRWFQASVPNSGGECEMLNIAKLRYLTIDVHSRRRRRIVVVCIWAAFVLGMAALETVLDNQSFSVRHPHLSLWATLAYVWFFYYLSIFRDGGVVRPFHFRTLPLAGFKGRVVLLSSLDDWARYSHGAALAELTEEQQQDVLRRYRVGCYYFPADKSRSPERLDERETMIRDRASTSTLRWVGFISVFCAGTLTGHSFAHLQPADIITNFFDIVFMVMAGPATAILWAEPDPRDSAELSLVEAPTA